MLMSLMNYYSKPFTAIDKSTIQVNYQPAKDTQYTISPDGGSLTKVGGAGNESRCCEVVGKPRPGKFFMRVRFNGTGNYSTILISNGLVTANNQVAWTSGSLAGNVWHEVKVEHVSGETYKFTVNGNQLYVGTAKNMSFYFHTTVTTVEFDVGQRGATPPAGFEWL